MSAAVRHISEFDEEIKRVTEGGDITREKYIGMLTLAKCQLEDWRDLHVETWDERVACAKELSRYKNIIASCEIALDIVQKAMREEVSAERPIEFMRDVSPFKNIMSAAYGLNSLGMPLPEKRRRKKEPIK